MGLFTRTILLTALVVLSASLAMGILLTASTEPSGIDRLTAARNFRRAIAYRTVDYQGGLVAPAHNERWETTAQSNEEKHAGSKIAHNLSLIALEGVETMLTRRELDAKIRQLETGGDGQAGIRELEEKIMRHNRKRRQTTSELNEIESRVRVFAMELEGYSYMIQSFQQRVFNLDYEVHMAVVEKAALTAEEAQVVAEAGRLNRDLADLEDQNYEISRRFKVTAEVLAAYSKHDPELPAWASRVGNPWLRGMVLAAASESRDPVIQLSIGGQDGVQKGQVFTVHRGPEFVARLRVEDVERNRAYGRLLDEFKGRAKVYGGDKLFVATNFGEAMYRRDKSGE